MEMVDEQEAEQLQLYRTMRQGSEEEDVNEPTEL
jgi:hypothetical protein